MNSVFRDTRAQSEECLCIEVKNDADHITARVSSYEAVAESIANLLDEPDPPDPWNLPERVGRVSTLSHAIASVRAVEQAYGYRIPPNADLVRNLMIGAQFVHDHVIHFYHLHALDWADMGAALAADPRKSAELQRSLSGWPNASEDYFARVQQRLVRFFGSGRLGVFANGYWGHPGYRLPAELNLVVFAHYLAVLDWPRRLARLHTLVAGRHSGPNFMVGGARCSIECAEASNAQAGAGLDGVGAIIAELQNFVDQVLVPDTLAIARFYRDWAWRGEGIGNFLTCGEFPAPSSGAHDPADLLIPRGAILDRDLSIVHAVDLDDPYQIQEHVSQARRGQGAAAQVACHPYDKYDDETLPDRSGRRGTRSRHSNRSRDQGRVPRWRGKPMEVGPLARVLMLYATGHRPMGFLVDDTLDDLELPLPALFSTLGRLIARTLETKLLVDQMAVWYRELLDSLAGGDRRMHNSTLCSPCGWPLSAMGVGYTEAPEGALAHWAVIDEGRIANYQTIPPAAWNAGPCDARGQEGPYAAALRGQCLHDRAQPLEILRTVHTFDPGTGCGVHCVGL